jgi:hypothetical protein
MNARHLRLFALGAALMLGAAAGRADESPPDRLEKKPVPAEPKRPEPPKPGDKVDEDKDKPKDAPAEDAEKLREKIAEDMQSAEKKLKDRDPGRDTQDMQDRALRNIDKLIDMARNPPPPPPQPPPMGGTPPPMGGDQQPQGGKPQPQPGQSRREKREQRRRQMEQQARGGGQQPRQPQPGDKESGGGGQSGDSRGQPGMGGPKGARQPDQLADVVKDFWGHLPETLRQEVDHYYRDRFMPRYRDLLQEYYGRIAERDRGRREDQK